jgi:diguanylate cyclase (GGDEF)-like protein/PAS domain S-box-containing protein
MRSDDSDVIILSAELRKAKETIANLEQRIQETIGNLEERTTIIINSVHAGIVLIDKETHRIRDANPEALRLMGVSKDQVVDKICHKYICPAEIGNCPIIDKGQVVDNSERVLLAADGKKIPILKTVASISFDGREHLLETFLDITQMKLLQKELEVLATTDSLTEIFNRRHFIELIEKEISRAKRSRTPLSVAMIDIDHFKRINDAYGHPIGDSVIKALVAIFKNDLRPYDFLGRLGGEEFAIAMVECDLQEAFTVSERLRERVMNHVIKADDQNINITISVGVAEISGDMESFESIINRADEALYLAKSLGRNRVEKALFEKRNGGE